MANPFQLKQPFVPDVAFFDTGADLSLADPRPVAFLARATYARYYSVSTSYDCLDVKRDPSVLDLWKKANSMNIPFSVYAYTLQNKIPEQANEFISYCTELGIISDSMWKLPIPPIVDIEALAVTPRILPKGRNEAITGRKYADQMFDMLTRIELAAKVRPLIYTSKETWKYLLTLGVIPPSWTKNYGLWAAWYPLNNYVDANVTYPTKMLPNGFNISQLLLWQYNDSGKACGYQYNDLNVATPIFMQMVGSNSSQGVPIDPQPVPEPLPQPTTTTRQFKVTASALNIRLGGGTNFNIIGTLLQDAIVDFVNELPDKTWIQIKRNDGLVGWCSAAYLNEIVSTPTPIIPSPVPPTDSATETIKTGVELTRGVVNNTNYYLVKMNKSMVRFMITPSKTKQMLPLKTSDFVANNNLTLGINGDQFFYGTKYTVQGTAAYLGNVYSNNFTEETIYIDQQNNISIKRPSKIYNAISFPKRLFIDGVVKPNLDNTFIAPRTSVAWDNESGFIYFLIVDGYEGLQGLTLKALSNFWLSLGINKNAVCMDSGGSSTLAIKDRGVVNHPIDDNILNKERPVANHIGIF